MKRLVSCLLLLPFLTSCEIKQSEYYDAGHYHSVPPRSEIYGYDEHPHDYRHARHRHHSRHKQPKNHSNQANVHGHMENNVHGHAYNTKQVIVPSSGQVVAPSSGQVNVHGHDNKKRDEESEPKVIIPNN